jgi:uncharacterized coiled-coil DUF342 family protein
MMRLVVALLIVVCLIPSLLFGQTTISLPDELNLLRAELLNSQKHLQALNAYISNLKKSLNAAEQSAMISAQRIGDLQNSLQKAQKAQQESKERVGQLQSQLIELSKSLDESKQIIQDNEQRQIEEIERLSKSYDRKIKTQRVMVYILAGALLVGAVYVVATP